MQLALIGSVFIFGQIIVAWMDIKKIVTDTLCVRLATLEKEDHLDVSICLQIFLLQFIRLIILPSL